MLPPIQFTELLSSLLLGSFGLSPRALAFGPPRRGLPGGSLLVVIVQGREPMPCHAMPCHAMQWSCHTAAPLGSLELGCSTRMSPWRRARVAPTVNRLHRQTTRPPRLELERPRATPMQQEHAEGDRACGLGRRRKG